MYPSERMHMHMHPVQIQELNWILASSWCQTNQCFAQIGEYHNQRMT